MNEKIVLKEKVKLNDMLRDKMAADVRAGEKRFPPAKANLREV